MRPPAQTRAHRARRASRPFRLASALLLVTATLGATLRPTSGPARASGTDHAKPPAAASAPSVADLREALEAALARPFLDDAQLGLSAIDLASGQLLYQRNDTVALNPASNVKLVTTAAALGILGPAHRYTTGLWRKDGALLGPTLKGDLYLQGSGDPALVTADLYEMAARLRALGIKRITGGVVVDASAFDRDELPPGFDQKNELASYRAPSGATVVNFNTFVVHARPGTTVGSPILAGVDPPVSGIALRTEATTEAGRRRKLLADYDAEGDGITLGLRGTLGVDSGSGQYRYPVDDPTIYAGAVLGLMLERNGIKLGRRKPRAGSVPRDARLVASHRSAPLGVLIRAVNKFSNNFMAEQILKTLDASPGPATFEGALARVRAHLEALGVPRAGLSLGNGSGLYDTNRVSPAQLTTLLAAVHRDVRIRPDYMASLSIMGVDGTTRSRLAKSSRRGWVRVKTGTLNGVSALSGYAGAPGRPPVAFSILINGIRRSETSQARTVQNAVAELLALYAAGEPLVVSDRR
ncbi:MAG: D-alanyl-D-alanine carboxypeptidase/D-alanyl-D-alanine-endopeptidase [Myxococcota bacterium]